jgi:hypothetical protein
MINQVLFKKIILIIILKKWNYENPYKKWGLFIVNELSHEFFLHFINVDKIAKLFNKFQIKLFPHENLINLFLSKAFIIEFKILIKFHK